MTFFKILDWNVCQSLIVWKGQRYIYVSKTDLLEKFPHSILDWQVISNNKFSKLTYFKTAVSVTQYY